MRCSSISQHFILNLSKKKNQDKDKKASKKIKKKLSEGGDVRC